MYKTIDSTGFTETTFSQSKTDAKMFYIKAAGIVQQSDNE